MKDLAKICVKIGNKTLFWIAITLMTILVIIVFSSVISRYFLNSSIAWAEELSRMILIWMVFIGAILAYANKEHLGLDIVVKLLPKKGGELILIFADVCILIALCLMVDGGITLTIESMDSLTPALEVPSGIQYMIVPFAGAVMALMTIFDAAKLISYLGSKK